MKIDSTQKQSPKMRNAHILTILVVLFITLILSCGKDVDRFIPDDIDPPPVLVGDIDNFFEAVKGDFGTSRDIQCNAYVIEILESGTIIEIFPNSFELPNDIDCSANNGFPLKLNITEIDAKGELIMFGRPTISDGKLIESRSELLIKVMHGEDEVKLRAGANYRVLFPDDNPKERMELFYGEGPREDFNWEQADRNDNEWNSVWVSEWSVDSMSQVTGFGYECWPDSLDWINCDIFIDVAPEDKTKACVELPEIYTNNNTAAFLVFDDFNSVLYMPGNADLMQFCESYGAVPIGYNVTFIVISEQGEDCYHFAQVSTTINADHLETITPVKTSLDDIKTALLAL